MVGVGLPRSDPGLRAPLRLSRTLAFFTSETFLLGKDGRQPEDRRARRRRDLRPPRVAAGRASRTPWTVGGRTYPAGSLLAARFDDFMAGKRELTVLFEPTPTTSLASYSWTRHHLILNVLDDVKSRLYGPDARQTGEWKREPFPGAPAFGTVSASGVDPDESDDYFMTVTDFLTPSTLLLGAIGKAPEKLKQTPAFFDASGLEISQHFATSKDGTRIPYFQVVAPRAWSSTARTPPSSTGYGGFEVSEVPVLQRRRRAGLAEPGRRLRAWPTSAAAASTAPRGTRRP